MISTSSRLLQLLSLLWSRTSWTAGELAQRMAVTERTVRRDVARLRDLGYDVESDPGHWGGYRLRESRSRLPLVLDDEEALAVSVALREAAQTRVLGDDQAVLSALLTRRPGLSRFTCTLWTDPDRLGPQSRYRSCDPTGTGTTFTAAFG